MYIREGEEGEDEERKSDQIHLEIVVIYLQSDLSCLEIKLSGNSLLIYLSSVLMM
mgnify:CR=1 FL=1